MGKTDNHEFKYHFESTLRYNFGYLVLVSMCGLVTVGSIKNFSIKTVSYQTRPEIKPYKSATGVPYL